ncbi:MAG: DUF3095 domain-containing protein [Burkholderiales bacterium]|nr:DUF3095 domain-containing protein [Burkholderiales bacterium]
MSSAGFYAALPVLSEFGAIADPRNFAPLPADWHVATCDVRDSTKAVEAGNYKHVNTVGASAVIAMLNAAGGLEIPFIFEGDGSAFCVPPRLLEDAKAALAKTQEMARQAFGLELRVATVPVAAVRAAGFDITVARVRVSPNYVQAMFAGGGMGYADRYMKDPATAPLCEVKEGSVAPRGSHQGLECRWQDIPSLHGETVSLMVRAASPHPDAAAATYREVIAKLREIYGSDEACHPLTPPALQLAPALGARQLGNEVGVQAAGRGRLGKWLWLMRVRWFVVLGWFLMKFGLRTEETDWSRYKDTLYRNTDVRKFNDVFRQILAGSTAQRERLDAWLEERYARRELVYGLHVTDRAHMTCLVFSYSGRHLHFIDGADGGLFLAAKAFKERAARLSAR